MLPIAARLFRWLSFSSLRRLLTLISVSVCAIGVIAYQITSKTPSPREVASKARPAMAAELARASAGFVLIAGDSHAASISLPCETVNLAVNGMKVRDVREQMAKLPIRAEPAAMLLIVGTNNLLRKHHPLDHADAWISEVREIIGRFKKVVVAAVPPIGSNLTSVFDSDGVQLYSHRLENMCSEFGCTYVDPWKVARSERFGEARSGFMDDHIHMTDYRPAARNLAPLLCSILPKQPEAVMADASVQPPATSGGKAVPR